MAVAAEPTAQLSALPKADGSASFAYLGYAVTAAVNGPMDIGRRDENPFEAVVDVVVRPSAGVGGTAERQLESIIKQALRPLIPLRDFPRTMIQVTLQITETPENAYANTKLGQAQLNLHVIPPLLHASVLGLLTAAVPMKAIASAAVLAASRDGIRVDPSVEEAAAASSVHVLGFTSNDELLLAESEGSFTAEEWGQVLQAGQHVCCRGEETGLDTAMGNSMVECPSIRSFMRSVVETKVAADLSWK